MFLNIDTKILNYKTSEKKNIEKNLLQLNTSKRYHYEPNKITKIEKTVPSAAEEAKPRTLIYF